MTVQEELRRRIDREVFDYRQVTDCLRDYAKPRDKIGALLASGFLVRVRKGLYVFGETWRRQPVAREAQTGASTSKEEKGRSNVR